MSSEKAARLIKAGDKIYKKQYGTIEVITIGRVTKTQAVCTNGIYKFRPEVRDSVSGYCAGIGEKTVGYGSTSWYIESEELKEAYFRQNTIAYIKGFDYSKAETDKLRQILAIINPA